jgi:hypothetical protein
MGPAPVTKLGHSGTQSHTSNGNEQNVSFQDPMSGTAPYVLGSPQNNGFDYWDQYNASLDTRLLVPAPGVYSVEASLSFQANSTGRRYMFIYRADTTNNIAREDEHTLTNTIVSMNAAGLARVTDATGCYFQLVAFQNSGGNLAYEIGTYSPNLRWTWLGLSFPAGN